jgi:CubicO group peptidase (beta-lactamase class C family)
MKLRKGSPEEAGIRPSTVEQIRKRAQLWVSEGSTPALVLVAARRGVIFLHEAFGRHGPEEDSAALLKNTLFPLASMSKTITATALIILVEDGLVGLNRPVQEYIPEFLGKGKEEVMVHQLLTHTSGMRDDEWMKIIEDEAETVEIPPPEDTANQKVYELLTLLLKTPLELKPGKEMVYADANYYLAGEIVRRLSGASLDQFTRERIFNPLSMDDTYFIVPEEAQDRVVRRPEEAPGFIYHDKEFMERPSPSGGAFSTALDMAKFGQMFLNAGIYGQARVLSPASVAAMTRDQIPGVSAILGDHYFPYASWGLGWSIGAPFKGKVYGELLPAAGHFVHGGYGGVEMWVDPTNEIVSVYFSVALEVDSHDFSIQDADLFMNMVTAGVIDDSDSGERRRSYRRKSKLSDERRAAESIRGVQHRRKDIVLRPGSPEEAGADPERVQKVVDLANGWVESGMHSSLTVVAARHGVVFLNETVGRLGPEEDAPLLKPDTLFPLASITKVITATAVMILVEEGLISLNRPVMDYIPEFQGDGQDQVLIRHLLTHTSGLSESDLLKLALERELITNSDPSDQNWAKLFAAYDKYMAVVRDLSPSNPPDHTMIYALCNYDLLAEVVAQASGSTFPDFVHRRIFEPLGMHDSFLPVPVSMTHRVVCRPDTAPFNKLLATIMETGAPSGFSAAKDMAIFGQMFLNDGIIGGERILSSASVEAMTRDQIPGIMAEYKQRQELGLW